MENDPAATDPARELLAADLHALDLACSRFRPDSELVAVGNAARDAARIDQLCKAVLQSNDFAAKHDVI